MAKWKDKAVLVLRALGLSEELDQASRWLGISLLGSAATLILGLIWDKPHWALVASAAFFALISIGLIVSIEIVQRIEVFRKLNVAGSKAEVIGTEGDGVIIQCSVLVLNSSRRTVFYRLREADLGISQLGSTRGTATTLTNTEPVVSLAPKPIHFATLRIERGVPNQFEAYAKFEIEYGYEANRFPYRLEFEGIIESERPSSNESRMVVLLNRTNEHFRVELE